MFRFIKKIFDTREERGILSFEQTEELAKSLGIYGRDLSFLIINTHKSTGARGQELVDILLKTIVIKNGEVAPAIFSHRDYFIPSISRPLAMSRYIESVNQQNAMEMFESDTFDYSKVEHIPKKVVEQIRESNPTLSADVIANMFRDCEFGGADE